MLALSPLIYLTLGFLTGKIFPRLKLSLSIVLAKCIIPFIIIWNVSNHFNEMAWVIIITMTVILLLFSFGQFFHRSAIKSLCFCYLNIGWLGLPIASSILGEQSARFMLAAYIGSSIVGNSIGANFLSGKKPSFKKILFSPPVIGLILGGAFIPMSSVIVAYGQEVYSISKFFMSLFGMMILGMWLAETKLEVKQSIKSVKSYFFRVGVLLLIVLSFFTITALTNWHGLEDYIPVLLLVCLLPPAANIIVLETYYLGSGESAQKISYETLCSLVAIAIYGVLIHRVVF
ncbi:permease [Photobacterium sp. 2_MG-2023]|uniref:permease n=1 Tax=Photobacterium sp. 2_MG-2023 TaxID=3062663 RepID=UPI0026E1EC11|nr:permease [Photobacterium sp. 2_MG-2023]MDO6580962.1 permease [Photobacterium sp. 2_MG-2023]